MEVLSIRAQFFCDITERGVEEARKMAFIVEKGHEVAILRQIKPLLRLSQENWKPKLPSGLQNHGLKRPQIRRRRKVAQGAPPTVNDNRTTLRHTGL